MSGGPSTPRRHDSSVPTTPQTTRVASSNIAQPSPHYQTTRRHSLYGTEDRIILDPGSRIWKVGFSGEGKPRDVFYAGGADGTVLWSLNRAAALADRQEEDRQLQARLQACLRSVFHDSLLTDPKSRKIIIVEHPLLPLHVKEAIARILFNNLQVNKLAATFLSYVYQGLFQVPSISFASSHLLALLATGRITGLVLDCGHLESAALPIFSSRPLFPQLRTTPLAGARLSSHLRALLLLFGTYLPPPTSLSAAANIPASTRATRVPEEVLTDSVIEEIKTRCCFVGDALDLSETQAQAPPSRDESMEMDVPPSESGMSESEFSHVSADMESNMSSAQAASSGYSVVSHSQARSNLDRPQPGESHLQAIANMYMRHSTATDLKLKVEPPASQQAGTGRGTLVIPGWIRERAAEVLFEGGDVDESSVAEVILDALLKAPVDLRKTLASSILVVGGTPMLPGFISRLHVELLRSIYPPASPSLSASASRRGRIPRSQYDKYACLRQLTPYFAILNNPSPPPLMPNAPRGSFNAGKAPAFSPAAMAWVGGSLAGALKIGGVEVPRERWDEADVQPEDEEEVPMVVDSSPPRTTRNILPDWTRGPLPQGAPPANPQHGPQQPMVVVSSPQTAVGA
ncbi:fungal-specific actin related protein [Cristinia sonorae]|uniref:Fungal-specific actin related protein n=1 Tax=Cristinia sonorae TaxID=1940300 RepID=A0A8K0UNP9_9AGAR|nr:fungal-specific actin related protein [Cristinia sonorae]